MIGAGPPPLHILLAEWPRGAWNMASLALAWKGLGWAPRGDGRPVLVLPGLVNSDRSNFAMRAFLRRIGYRPFGWRLGRNLGVRAVGQEAERLIARVEAIHAETGAKVTLVGISLGGIMARLVARRRPDLVEGIVTISAPFAGPATATNVWRAFEWLTGEKISDPAVLARQRKAGEPLAVPATAIWSRSDGLVNGLICRDEQHGGGAMEVRSSHIFVQFNPRVLRALAQALVDQRGSGSPAR